MGFSVGVEMLNLRVRNRQRVQPLRGAEHLAKTEASEKS